MPVFAAMVVVLFGIPGAVLAILGWKLARAAKLDPQWVPVQAFVVSYANFTRPRRVTFDYPLPDGSWTRASKVAAALSTVEPKSVAFGLINPGDRFTVYVNPRNPYEVSLGAYGAARPLPWVMFGFGLLLVATAALALLGAGLSALG